MVAPTAPDAIKMAPVTSSKLLAIGYDDSLFILRLQFNPSKTIYDYFDVEPEKHAALMASDSKGKYAGQNIIGPRGGPAPYPFAKVGSPDHARLWKDALAGGQGSMFEEKAEPVKRAETVTELPRQKSRSQVLAEVEPARMPEVALPSDEEGLTKRAEEVVHEAQALVVVSSANGTAALSVKTPEHYALVVSTLVAKKAELKRALAEVALIKDPATAAWKAACAFENKVKASYESAISVLDQACTGFRREVAAEEARAAKEIQDANQRKLDAEHAAESKRAADEAKAAAENMRAAGQHEVAKEIEATPVYVPRQVAAPVVQQTIVPKVAGARVSGTWKFRVANPNLVERFYMAEIAMALQRAGLPALDEAKLGSFTMDLGRIWSQFHSLDEVKVGGRIRPAKEAGVGLIPGVDVWFDEKTGSTGR